MHPFASSVLTLTCDSDALVQPNPLWAAWALNALMDEADQDLNSSVAVPSTVTIVLSQNRTQGRASGGGGGTQLSGAFCSAEQDLLSSDIFSADVFTSLMQCAQTPNMALKEILFRICTRILSKVLRALEMDNDVLSLQEIHQYLTSSRHAQLVRVFSTRMRKEHSIGMSNAAATTAAATAAATNSTNSTNTTTNGEGTPNGSAVHSSYLHVLAALLVHCDRLRAHTLNDHHRRGALRYRSLGSSAPHTGHASRGTNGGAGGGALSAGMPSLFLDDVTSTSVTIGWWLDPAWVKALRELDTQIEIQVEMAQIVFDDHPTRLSGLVSLDYVPVRNGVIAPVVEYYIDTVLGTKRSRTVSKKNISKHCTFCTQSTY